MSLESIFNVHANIYSIAYTFNNKGMQTLNKNLEYNLIKCYVTRLNASKIIYNNKDQVVANYIMYIKPIRIRSNWKVYIPEMELWFDVKSIDNGNNMGRHYEVYLEPIGGLQEIDTEYSSSSSSESSESIGNNSSSSSSSSTSSSSHSSESIGNTSSSSSSSTSESSESSSSSSSSSSTSESSESSSSSSSSSTSESSESSSSSIDSSSSSSSSSIDRYYIATWATVEGTPIAIGDYLYNTIYNEKKAYFTNPSGWFLYYEGFGKWRIAQDLGWFLWVWESYGENYENPYEGVYVANSATADLFVTLGAY